VEQLTELPGPADTAASAANRDSTGAALALIARLPRDEAEAAMWPPPPTGLRGLAVQFDRAGVTDSRDLTLRR